MSFLSTGTCWQTFAATASPANWVFVNCFCGIAFPTLEWTGLPMPRFPEKIFFDLTRDDGIRRLKRGDWGDGRIALHLRNTEVGNPDMANLTFLLQAPTPPPTLPRYLIRFGPMDLVEIDDIGLQAAQTVFELSPN